MQQNRRKCPAGRETRGRRGAGEEMQKEIHGGREDKKEKKEMRRKFRKERIKEKEWTFL